MVCARNPIIFNSSITTAFRVVTERHWRGKIFPKGRAESGRPDHLVCVEEVARGESIYKFPVSVKWRGTWRETYQAIEGRKFCGHS